ncbi:MAG: PAS domain S-box protein [Syntrophorhabdaceae bacterium]
MKNTTRPVKRLVNSSSYRGDKSIAEKAGAGHRTSITRIGFNDVFNKDDLRELQQTFTDTFGVASVILDRKGAPITEYIGFSDLLNSIARRDGMTFFNCMTPSLVSLKPTLDSPEIRQCPNCGLLYGIIPIMAGNHRLASWLIGQVLDEDADLGTILARSKEIGVDREDYRLALLRVPRMTRVKFEKICGTTSIMAKHLSMLAMQTIVQARDIAASIETEKALRASEVRYRQMFNNNPFPSMVYDIGTLKIIDVNDMAVKHYGYSREEFLTKTMKDIRPPEDVEHYLKVLEDSTSKRRMISSRHIKKDGSVMDVEVTGHLLDFPEKQHRIITAIDVTGRKQTEERLRFTQTVVDRVVDCIFWLDSDARIVYANDAACKITGYSYDELLSMTMLDIDPYLTRDLWHKHWLQKKAAGSLLFDSYHRSKSGRIYPVEVSASYVVYDNKEYNCTFIRDITERKKAEEELLLTRFTVDSAAAIILWLGEDARILYANDEACINMGYSRDEILGMSVPDIDPGFPLPVWKKHWNNVKKKGTVVFESFQRRKDGSFYPVEIKGNYITYGNIGYICSIAFDITERKKTEELLKMTQFSVDQSAIPTFWLSMDGRAIRVNKAACTSLGYSEHEILGMHVKNWDEDFPYDTWNEIHPRLKAQHATTMQSRYKTKDGNKFPVEINLNYMEYNNNEYVFAFARDISERVRAEEERKKLQAQLLQSQKMEAIGQLAGGIAHDFNNILTALIGYGNLLETEMAEDDPLQSYVEEILASSKRAANLTQSLLSFSRKQTINLAHHNLNEIISGVQKLLKRLLSEDIDLELSLADTEMTVLADITHIQQVILNLATNARDAMPSGGKLSIATERVRNDDSFIRSQDDKGLSYAKISVSDNGEGMDQQVLTRIFEPFFTTKEVGKGTGLGLSIVYGIIKQHNGFISVTSEKRNGTAFHIYIPLNEEDKVDVKLHQREMRRGGGTILLAEDNAEVRRLAKDVLKRTGYSVIEASDGQEALDLFIEHRDSVDLIIIDVVMPRKNGRDVANEIKTLKPEARILFTSGYTRDILSNKGMHDTEFNFLSKPLSPYELLEKIQDMMGTKDD